MRFKTKVHQVTTHKLTDNDAYQIRPLLDKLMEFTNCWSQYWQQFHSHCRCHVVRHQVQD